MGYLLGLLIILQDTNTPNQVTSCVAYVSHLNLQWWMYLFILGTYDLKLF